MLDQAQPEPDGPAFTAKAQILPGSEAAAERKDSSPPSSELSTGKMNPRAPGWNKRLRTVAATPSRPPCPNRTNAFEKAVRSYAENPTENVITPTVGTSFDSVGEAYDFYNLYSWEKGFGIRYSKSRLNVERTKCMQEIVCGCSGKAGVENTRSCRCECPALIMAGPMHQRQVANATTAVSRHNAIDAGPPGFGRSTATSVGVQQTEGDENEMGNILQEITEMQATAVDGGRRHVISSCKNITIGMECARARNVTVKHENDEDSCRQPRVLDIDGKCARKLQKELDEEFGK
ncbi:uncharacterized protein LOC119278979 [Triticum dicoccoides]|uniref:uncharacterized protein LOC119278979 n=1 Tax=Triticum dicoccoides TaxID=85692 RepID=UPI00188EEB52|nr:uncharacterized protein LOC119278979 [Triticum dicoccoides]